MNSPPTSPESVSLNPSDEEGNGKEIKRLKTECVAMVRLLSSLQKQEVELTVKNEILAREAVLCGFSSGCLEPPAPKRRKTANKKNNDTSSTTT